MSLRSTSTTHFNSPISINIHMLLGCITRCFEKMTPNHKRNVFANLLYVLSRSVPLVGLTISFRHIVMSSIYYGCSCVSFIVSQTKAALFGKPKYKKSPHFGEVESHPSPSFLSWRRGDSTNLIDEANIKSQWRCCIRSQNA